MPSQSVLVIGGGLGGLSSAVALAEAGCQVRLLEKRPHLGGRATSYTLPDGSEVNNCQHVTLGCCTNLADFYRRVGASEKIHTYDRLFFADRRGRVSVIRSSWLPPPLHLAPSFLSFHAMTFADKRCIAQALWAIALSGGSPANLEGISMLDWLQRMKQTSGAVERFWRAVLVSSLDEELGRTDARYGIDVFWKAFLKSRRGYCLGIPSVPLAQLYEGCREALVRRGGEVRHRCGVRSVCIEGNRFEGVLLEDGTRFSADACIAAVPHDAALHLLPKEMSAEGGPLEGLRHIRTSPITSVHLWFESPVMEVPFLALLDHTTQWIFNKTALYGARPAKQVGPDEPGQGGPESNGQYLQLVISAAYDLVSRSRQEIIELCRRELAEVLPATRDARLQKATVIKEVNATFSPQPGIDRLRPKQKTGVENLFLAGDWTQTGWPATMEGAVRSGYLAAESLLAAAGRSQQFLQPDLPIEGLSRFWSKQKTASDA